MFLHKGRQVPRIVDQLLALIVDDVACHGVQEARRDMSVRGALGTCGPMDLPRVVTDDETCHSLLRHQVLFQPLHGGTIKLDVIPVKDRSCNI